MEKSDNHVIPEATTDKPVPFSRFVLHVFALSGLALAQPLYSWMSAQPEFLVAHGARLPETLLIVFVLTFGLPLLLLGVITPLRLAGIFLWPWVQSFAVGVLAGVLLLYLLSAQTLWVVFGIALAVVLLTTLLYRYWVPFQVFLGVMAIAALVYPLAFVFTDPVRSLAFAGDAEVLRVTAGLEETPEAGEVPGKHVVLLMLDELPLTSLLDEQGEIDGSRYPAFARLAATSDWYPRMSTVAVATGPAVTAAVTVRLSSGESRATWQNHSPNLFTWAAGVYGLSLRADETTTFLCPPGVCDRASMKVDYAILVEDVLILLGHALAPRQLADRYLPALDDRWYHFGVDRFFFRAGFAAVRSDRTRSWRQFMQKLGEGFQYKHLLLPHAPLTYQAEGARYFTPLRNRGYRVSDNIPGHYQVMIQRHHQQLQYVDRLLGELMDKLKETGRWDDTLLLVTADHGHAYRPGEHGRRIRSSNLGDIVNVPLFIKRPGQSEGRIDDYPASIMDIAPTIADVIGEPLGWDTDGVSLLDPARPEREHVDVACVGVIGGACLIAHDRDLRARVPLMRYDAGREASLNWRNRHLTYMPGSNFPVPRVRERQLLGRRVDEFEVTEHETGQLALFDSRRLESVEPESGVVPALLAGYLEGEDFGEDDALVVALNGRLVGVALVSEIMDGDDEVTGLMLAALLPHQAFSSGENRVGVYHVQWEDGSPVALEEVAVVPAD